MRPRREAAKKRALSDGAKDDATESEPFEDSGDEYKEESAAKKRKSSAGPAKRGRPSLAKNGNSKKTKKPQQPASSDEDDDDKTSSETDEDADASPNTEKTERSSVKTKPDKDGFMELLMFKNDLSPDFRTDEKLCMWRREASLLQKYIFVIDESKNKTLLFKASSVYSCWEEKRKTDFFHFKVQLVGNKKDDKVKVIDLDDFIRHAEDKTRPTVDISPKGAEGGETYEEDSEAESVDGDDDDEE